jgi:hypothetical protein
MSKAKADGQARADRLNASGIAAADSEHAAVNMHDESKLSISARGVGYELIQCRVEQGV